MNFEFSTFGSVVDSIYAKASLSSSTSYPGLSRTEVEKDANRKAKRFLAKVDTTNLEESFAVLTIADTAVADGETVTAGTTSFDVNSASLAPATGAILLDNIPMTFTRSSNTLTVPALARDFKQGDTVKWLYKLPTDMLRPRSVYIDSREYMLTRYGDNAEIKAPNFAFYGDYLVVPGQSTGGKEITLHYLKRGETLTSSNTMQIADMFEDYIIESGAARCFEILQDWTSAQASEARAKEILHDARSFFARQNGSNDNKFLPAF